MDIGRCQKCRIEGPFGSIHIMASDGIVYVAFASPEQKQVQKHLQKLISAISLQMKQGAL
jgi:hypothetical protein